MLVIDIQSETSLSLLMPRKLRVEYPGAIYHVMSRGDRREDIYLNDVDRQDFIRTTIRDRGNLGYEWP